MSCKLNFQWVKLPRNTLPPGKGVMGYWAKLAARSAFRKGNAVYCGFSNPVVPGMWSGGFVGLKSILGLKSRSATLAQMQKLSRLGYVTWSLDTETKKLDYQIADWVVKCSGAPCTEGAVYATEGYGFLCLPRSITQRLAREHYIFEEADAWLDLWCHTVYREKKNTFSHLAPAVQYGSYGAILTLETLGRRWGWEKTKVWRFFRKHRDTFALYRLPGRSGCVIFNGKYPGHDRELPSQEAVIRVLGKVRLLGGKYSPTGSEQLILNKLVAWCSARVTETETADRPQTDLNSCVAVSAPILRAYLSPRWNSRNCKYDCKVTVRSYPGLEEQKSEYGRAPILDLGKAYEFFTDDTPRPAQKWKSAGSDG